MLIAAAVCPHPPLLVPELAGGLAPALDGLRAACDTAIGRVYAAEPDSLLVLGATQNPSLAAVGSFREYGLDLRVDGGWASSWDGEDDDRPMPLPMLVAAWLLRDRPLTPPRTVVCVPENGRANLAALGRTMAAGDRRVAMLVMGDGSACRSPQAPGHFDERAEAYDAAVGKALAAADTAALAALDPELSRDLLAAGRPAWQVLAGAAASAEQVFDSELLYAEAPYGVGYFVASWTAG
jgi:hypothetical protein